MTRINDDSGGILSPCRGSLENEMDDYNALFLGNVDVFFAGKFLYLCI